MRINPLHSLGRSSRRKWRLGVLGLLLLIASAVGVGHVGARRHAALRLQAAEANASIAAARQADAMTWAPDELLAAEAALGTGLTALRVEQVRWWPVPDVARVTTPLAEAAGKAARAAALAGDRRDTARRGADAALAAAGQSVASSIELAESIHLGSDRRALLARARLALAEAGVYRREGDYGTATLRARQAATLAEQVRDHAAAVTARYADAETIARWQRWKQDTIAWSRREGRAAIVVSKEAHTLTLFLRGEPFRTYRADMGFNWVADKVHAGDGATPEGRYRVVARKAQGASLYHKALLLDYPNAEDRAEFAEARRAGELPSSAAIGGLIEIHGEGGRGRDWTRGCVAVTNREMDELFAHVQVGTPVTIVGSDDYGAIASFAARHRDSAGR